MCLSICTFPMVMDYRSSAGYTPLDFAFVVAGSKGKGVVEMLDSDHQLLPRGTDPPLKKEIIEVWKKQQQQQPNKQKKKTENVRSRYSVVLPIPPEWKFL